MLYCKECPHFNSIPSAKVENRMSAWGLCSLHLMSTHKDAPKLNQCPEPNPNHDILEAHTDA